MNFQLHIYSYLKETNSDLAGGQDDAGQPAQEPPAGEGGDGGERRRGETHHHVGQGHVAYKQVDPAVKAGCPALQKTKSQVEKIVSSIFRGFVGGNFAFYWDFLYFFMDFSVD